MNRRAVIVFPGLISGVLLLAGTGCEPEFPEEELGRVEYRMPDESEIGRKYELPDLSSDEPTEAATDTATEAVEERAADESVP